MNSEADDIGHENVLRILSELHNNILCHEYVAENSTKRVAEKTDELRMCVQRNWLH
jgi:hypothetical protein